MALALVASCTMILGNDFVLVETVVGEGGGSSTSTSGTGAGGGGGGSSSSSSTSSGQCPVDLVAFMGASEECNACVGEFCCAQAEAYVAQRGGAGTYEALHDCAFGGRDGSPCSPFCMHQICDSGFFLPFVATIAECLSANCCDPITACAQNQACADNCLFGFDPDYCCQATEYVAYYECQEGCGMGGECN